MNKLGAAIPLAAGVLVILSIYGCCGLGYAIGSAADRDKVGGAEMIADIAAEELVTIRLNSGRQIRGRIERDSLSSEEGIVLVRTFDETFVGPGQVVALEQDSIADIARRRTRYGTLGFLGGLALDAAFWHWISTLDMLALGG